MPVPPAVADDRDSPDAVTADGPLGLVLGGGGIAGIAWHAGILCGLAEAGVDLGGAARLVGTSAGATVAVQVASGLTARDLVDRQTDPGWAAVELTPSMSVTELWERMAPIYTESADDDRRRRLCRLALDADTVDEPLRRRVIAARLAGCDWGDGRVSVVVCDAATGSRRVFDATSGVDVVDAVTASSAVPGVWPPATIGDHRYVDGGIWSATNADLATGCEVVVVLAPMFDRAVKAELTGLGPGVRSVVVRPDEASLAAFGDNVLDPAARGPSARAGLVQGRVEAARIAGTLAP